MTVSFEDVLNSILKFPPLDFVCDGIPAFSPRCEEEQAQDKYEKDWIYVNCYTGWAYGFKSSLWSGDIGLGGAEGLYRTVDSFLMSSLQPDTPQTVLDLGCGVGRTIYDCAPQYPQSFFIGMDFSYKMCRRAKEILLDGADVSLDGLSGNNLDDYWPGRGFPGLVFDESKTLQNVKIMQGSATRLPFKGEVFDCVISTLLMDRVRDREFQVADDIEIAIAEIKRVLKQGGRLILSTPMNFSRVADWMRFNQPERIVDCLEAYGFRIQEKFDGLVYREIQDARGNYQDWLVFFVYGKKENQP